MSRSTRRVQVTVAGSTRTVAVDESGQVTVEGVDEAVAVDRLDATTFRAVVNGRRLQVSLVDVAGDWWAAAAGCQVTVETDSADRGGRAGRRSRPGAPDLTAPMPATVVAVLADPGQTVRQGEVLVTLEAMKMELAVRAPHDGRIAAVNCQPGDLVQPGLPLVVLEAEPGAS